MGTGAVLSYGAVAVLRSRRRTALFLAGLSLAVATLATPTIAIDSEIRGLVDRLVDSIPYDYHIVGRTAPFDEVTESAALVPGVLGVEPFVPPESGIFFAGRADANGTGIGLTAVGITFVRPSFARFSEHLGLVGSFDLAPGEVAITDRVAVRAGLGLGDEVTLWHPDLVCYEEPFQCLPANWTASYRIGAVLTTVDGDLSSGFRLPVGSPWPRDTLFASFDTLVPMSSDLKLAVQDPPRYAILVWADRSNLIDPYEPVDTKSRVLSLRREIEAAIRTWGNLAVAEATDPTGVTKLSEAVQVVSDGTASERALFILVSLPALTLAFVLSRVNFQAGLARRRREIGVLRSRGWSARQVSAALLLEAAVVGVLAAAIGIVVGIVLSGFLLDLAASGPPTDLAQSGGSVRITATSVVIALGSGVGLAVLVAHPIVRRASRLRITRALQEVNSLETAVDYRESHSILFVALGAAGVFGALGFAGISGEAGFLTFLFGTGLAALIVLAPVFLILGVARYATLGTDAPYRLFARTVRPWTGDLHYLVAEGLRRQPRRSSDLAVLIAFGLAFAMFIVGFVGVLETNELRLANTAAGGDLFFETASASREDLQGFAVEPGVEALAVADFVGSNYGVVVAVNATDYLAVVPWMDGYYFREGGLAALASLPGGGAIANGVLADALGIHIGDPVVLNIYSGRLVFSLVVQVSGIVISLPGLQPSGGSTDLHRFIVVDADRLIAAAGTPNYPLTSPGRRAILRTTEGADPHDLAKALEARWSGRSVVRDDLLTERRLDPFRTSLFGLLYTQAGLAVLVLVAAVALSTYATGIEREAEFATIAARGLGGRGLVAILFGEGLSVSLVGALVAVPIVLTFLWGFIRFEDVATPVSLPLEFGMGPPAWGLLAAALGAAAVGALLAGLRLYRMNLPAILKLRGM